MNHRQFITISASFLLMHAACAASSDQPSDKNSAQPCDVKSSLASLAQNVSAEVWDKLNRAFFLSSDQCNSMRDVLGRLASTTKAGGRKLEKDKSLDVGAAERERQKAAQDPEFSKPLVALMASESDSLRQKFLEAALLHDQGHYLARDLVLQQLSSSLGK